MKQKRKTSNKTKKEFSFHPSIRKAFGELKTLGFFAEENHTCCGSCGFVAIPLEHKNVVFYHNQDLDDLQEEGECHLSWSGDAEKIVEVLNKHHIKTEWDGKPNMRIKMKISKDIV